jgi:hypothetical protein
MLTREEILSSYKKVNYPEKLFDKSVKEVKNILFYDESTGPNTQKEKDIKKLSQSYVLPWRLVQKNYPDSSNNKNNAFSRGGNFAKKEPLIEIKYDNIKLIYDKYSLPIETGIIYLKNNYGGTNGPYNLEQIKNLSKNKKLDSAYEFRLIDIFTFKDLELFSFQSIKIINDEKWIDLIIDSPLLKYNELYKNISQDKKEDITNNEIKEEKNEEITNNEIKKEEKKEDITNNELKEEKKEEKQNEIKKEDKKEKQNNTNEIINKQVIMEKKTNKSSDPFMDMLKEFDMEIKKENEEKKKKQEEREKERERKKKKI